jgi:hypothetical protein
MTRYGADTEDGTVTVELRQYLTKWGKPVALASLLILHFGVGAATLSLTTVSVAQAHTDEGDVGAASDNMGLFRGLKSVIDQTWCWLFSCPDPVAVSQSETVIIEDRVSVRQAESSSNQTTTAASVDPNVSTDTTTTVSEEKRTAEVASETPVEAATEPAQRGDSSQQSASSPRIIKAMPERESNSTLWWPLVVDLLLFTTVVLTGVTLYRRFGHSNSLTESTMYPATLRPRIVRSKPSDTNRNAESEATEAAHTSEPTQIRLTDARSALNDGATDQSVGLAIQALASASDEKTGADEYEALLETYESTASELSTLPSTLEQLHHDYEQATFSPQSVSEENAMDCIGTVEALLGASEI